MTANTATPEYLNSHNPMFPQPDMSTAVKVGCPVCQVYASYGAVCNLCKGAGIALMLPTGALFSLEAGK